ncbi:MAG: hypothetical protein AMS21_06490 [Gemmatimonas sp. SG8_38_2]|nr:MAG: hypothetical protein AMS21_06490 [Gemmatimonas sp. SG8_38_2]
MHRTGFLLLVVTATMLSTAAFAQDTPARVGFAAGASAGFADLGGDAFENLSSAFGLEASARYTWAGNFQALIGFHYGSHEVGGAADSDVSLVSIFADGRYVLAMMNSQRFSPYVGGRIAYVGLSPSAAGIDGSSGFSIGGLVGFLFEVAPRLAIEAYGYFGGLVMGDAVVLPSDTDDSNGNLTIVQFGLVYTLGG